MEPTSVVTFAGVLLGLVRIAAAGIPLQGIPSENLGGRFRSMRVPENMTTLFRRF